MLLQKIRDHAKGWFAYTIIGLLTVPFAVWGINYYFEAGGPMDAAVVGGHQIPLRDFQRSYQQQRQRMQAMLGANADPALLEGPQFKQQVLQRLINEQVVNRLTQSEGLRISDLQLYDALKALPVFQENGGFNDKLYEQLLRSQGYTPESFEEGFRQSLATAQLQEGIVASALVTPAELAQVVSLLKQQRDLQYVVLSLEKYLAKATVDDAAIQKYFEQNKEHFVNPEQVRVQFIELNLVQIAQNVEISEDQLRTSYQEQIAKYGQPEERSASYVLVKLPPNAGDAEVEKARAQAQQIANSIHSGTKKFDEALQEAQSDQSGGLEGGDLGVITSGMFTSPAFEKALYALQKPGDVSDPVRMPSGFHIIRLDRITPAQVKPFEEVRETVAKELRHQQAENRFYEISQTLANLSYEHPDNLESAATALSVPVQESVWFSRQGGGEGIIANSKVINSAFGEDVLKRGVNSEPIELEPGHVVVIRIKEHKDPTPRTLEEAREDIAKLLRRQQAVESLSKDTEALRARAAQGQHLQTLATEFGGEYKNAGLVGRDASSVDGAILEAAFRLPHPQADQVALGATALTNGDQSVFEVARVVPGQLDVLSEDERKTLAQQLEQQAGSKQFAQLLDSVRSKTKIVIYSDRL